MVLALLPHQVSVIERAFSKRTTEAFDELGAWVRDGE
jgi:hypothetical protein